MTEENRSLEAEKSTFLSYLGTAGLSLAVGVCATFIALGGWRRPPASLPVASAPQPADPGGMPGMPGMEGMKESSGGEHPTAPGGRVVFISPARQQLIGVRTAAVGYQELGTTIRTVGTLAYDETRVTEIHTKVSGWVDRVYVDSVGKAVHRGEPLFTLYSPELVSTQNEYLLALRNKKQLESSDVPTTRSGADSLLSAARDRLRLWDIPEEHIKELEQSGQVQRTLMLHSPFNGVVLERKAFPGQYVTPDMPTFKIGDLSTVWVLGTVFEYELPLVTVGQEADIQFPYGSATSTLKGRIAFIYPDIDPQTRRARIRAEFPNPGLKLKPETYVNVVIRTAGGRRLAVPKEAVIDTGTKRYVLLAHPNGYFEPREIEVDQPSDEFYQILGGLKEGDRIVTSAQFLVDSETNLQAAMQSMLGMPGMDMKAGGEMEKDMPMPKPTPRPSPAAADQK